MRSRSWLLLAVGALLPIAAAACGLDDTVVAAASEGDGGTSGGDATVGGDGGASTNDDGSVTLTSDGSTGGDPEGGPRPPDAIVYANAMNDLYSVDVSTNVVTHLGTFASCGSTTNLADIAIDTTGQLYLNKQSDAFYKLSKTGTCSGRWVADMDNGQLDKIAARPSGTPLLAAFNGTNDDYYSIDIFEATSTGTAITGKLNADLFPGATGIYDFTCNHTGTCWTALGNQLCSAGLTSSCLYSFPADGSAKAVSLGAIGVQPIGLAYANGALYSFAVDGTVAKIPLTTPYAASTISLAAGTGTTLPVLWEGAASSPAN